MKRLVCLILIVALLTGCSSIELGRQDTGVQFYYRGADSDYFSPNGAMGAERQLAALPAVRAKLREFAPLCAKRIELARNETASGQAFEVWYESAEERMSLPEESLFWQDEPSLAAARLAYLEANRATLFA